MTGSSEASAIRCDTPPMKYCWNQSFPVLPRTIIEAWCSRDNRMTSGTGFPKARLRLGLDSGVLELPAVGLQTAPGLGFEFLQGVSVPALGQFFVDDVRDNGASRSPFQGCNDRARFRGGLRPIRCQHRPLPEMVVDPCPGLPLGLKLDHMLAPQHRQRAAPQQVQDVHPDVDVLRKTALLGPGDDQVHLFLGGDFKDLGVHDSHLDPDLARDPLG